ncbi:Eco57I restriction-modification methylase domain-containing protein [Limimaricola cinnabarinus]|uniref:site-specific DNA-methyltransferase (adenine-specific) n=1 Tax=Limimaricola cinnabarinus LL-001 TaxID=1337093 RepID=U3ADW1_9RHOB|nr:N-6 DNA methylase [Limimaricola cinnabarinus]GAD55854.1 hypothetical protein MBELCI_1906 [Limimaricola cinnabarinus LL-001]
MTLHTTLSIDTSAGLVPDVTSLLDPILVAEVPPLLREAAWLTADLPEAVALDLARSMVHLAARTAWAAQAPDLPLRAFPASVDDRGIPDPAYAPEKAQDLARAVGRLAGLGTVAQATSTLGALYTSLLPRPQRKAHGVYYTPPTLAALMTERAGEAGIDWHRARVIDPACGAGALLLPTLERMLARLADQPAGHVLDEIGRRLRGIDLDPVAAWIAQVGVDMRLAPWCRQTGRPAPRVAHAGCGLAASAEDGCYDLVLANPPYGQLRLDAATRARFAQSINGRANLYALFCQRAVELTRPGGALVLLTPTGFLGGEYFAALRRYLATEAAPLSIETITARKGVFEGVQQETVVTTCRRADGAGEGGQGHVEMRALHVGSDDVVVEPLGLHLLPAAAGAPWLLPRRGSQHAIARAMGTMPARLADWGYEVRTGPVDGSDRSREDCAGTAGAVPMLWPEAVSAQGLDWPRAKRGRSAWYRATGQEMKLVTRPCLLLQRTTALEQPRRLVAAVLEVDLLQSHGAVAIENHLNILAPVGPCPAVPLEVLCAVFNSVAASEAFRCLSGSTAVSAYELRHLPLPDPAALVPLSALVAAGADPEAIEAECLRLYAGDLPAAEARPGQDAAIICRGWAARRPAHRGWVPKDVPAPGRTLAPALDPKLFGKGPAAPAATLGDDLVGRREYGLGICLSFYGYC